MMTTIREDCPMLLPDEITTSILLLLPTESLMQCKLVCKTWLALIANPVFIDLYHRKAPEAPIIFEWVTFCNKTLSSYYHLHLGEYNEESEINPFKHSQPIRCRPMNTVVTRLRRRENCVCSCNGLIFFISILGSNMFVCNPFTREYVDLPLPPDFEKRLYNNTFLREHHISFTVASGFGYNSYTNEYKIVIIYYLEHYRKCSAGYVTIYTLGSGKWRDKGEISPKLIFDTEPGVFLNGALHWLTDKEEIVSFDLADEEFRIVPSPPKPILQYVHDDNNYNLYNPNNYNPYKPKLGLLGGCLYVIRKRTSIKDSTSADMGGEGSHLSSHGFQLYIESSELDIWVMNNELQSWKWEFTIPTTLGDNLYSDDYKPLALSKSGKLILLDIFGKNPLVSYDPETKSSIVDDSFSKSSEKGQCILQIIHYVKSFVSLKALGETNAVDQVYNGDQKPMICEHLLHI